MISHALAERLRAAIAWAPSPGDRFVIPNKEMDDEVFHVAEMTIEVHTHHGAETVKFNGTTEWALDSLPKDDVLWLPREDQLRARLGARFVSLDAAGAGFVVALDDGSRHADVDAERAYARAVLHVLEVPS